ncbi:glycosyltransferase [Chitinivibrio alkaliphilus]|uniref:Alpha 1,4-glycosyltransferase domain-containing protein n=1 Tax=Chitinivibrio alkaliphilus ACht1 TaxID=1313304 RepID=U7D7F2_9BACT|nr:glycosyltransferase [Chitinivibrio alkaliphilus]ERP31511.1 hypothetical protein CALK_1555 [Chitinivibrio alkaliphilus ACht1]
MTTAIQSLWIGRKLSLIEQLCIKSYLALGYEFKLYIYDTVQNIPENTTICDAKTILPEDAIFTSRTGSVALFADWFRWKLLYEQGGIWVDMDLIGLKRFKKTPDIQFGCEEFGVPSIGYLKFPKKHALPRFMVNACEHPNRFLPYDSPRTRVKKAIRYILGNNRANVGWGESGGPIGFGKALRYFDLMDRGEPYTAHYPVPAASWRHIFDDTFAHYPGMIGDAYAVHLWNEHIRRSQAKDSINNYSEKSLFAYLLKTIT